MSTFCATAKVVASVLDGASERALLIGQDGSVLHMNEAADHFLFKGSASERPIHVKDFLVLPEDTSDWKDVQHSRIIMASGQTTRSERNLHWVTTASCPCCSPPTNYLTLYICSKHERVREIVDHALDPVLTADETGTICTANDAACALFGYTEGELVGHNLSMICGGGHAAHHDTYMHNYLTTGIKKLIGKKREVPAKKKNGDEFICELGLQEISDVSSGKRYFCGFLKDLTWIKQHEAELQERQDLAQGMINASTDSMFEIDQTGKIQIVNDAACSMFGYTREEFIGSNISIICGPADAPQHDMYIQRYLQTGERRIIGRKRQVQAQRKNGTHVEVELSVQEVILKTGQKAFCGFIRDLTQQKKDKRALRKQQQLIHGKFFGGEEEG